SNKGINPGGEHTAIVYENFMGEDGLPRAVAGGQAGIAGHEGHGGQRGHAEYFKPEYYQGKVPVFDPQIFHTTPENYERGLASAPPAGGPFDYPTREQHAALPRLDLIDAERHRP